MDLAKTETILEKIVKYLQQPSTLRGITIISGLAGWGFKPEMANSIIAVCTSVIGLIEILRDEKK